MSSARPRSCTTRRSFFATGALVGTLGSILVGSILVGSILVGSMLVGSAAIGQSAAPNDHLPAPSHHLFVWAGDSDREHSDFLAVVDVAPDSQRYGEIVATLPVGRVGMAHHTEHRMAADGRLFANAFAAGETFVFDLTEPTRPELLHSFTGIGPSPDEYTYPHSFERTPSGNLLATFQNRGEGNLRPGGLVELTPDGELLQAADAADALDPELRPYSLGLVPELDRVVSTTSDMRLEHVGSSVQLWRLSDLERLATLPLPPGPRGDEHRHPAEARVLADGRQVLVTTFSCGFYLLDRLDTEHPRVRLVHSYPAPRIPEDACAVPVRSGRFWVHPVPALHALVSLDLSDPEHPREVGRLPLERRDQPHWLSLEPGGERIVVTGYGTLAGLAVLVRLDRGSGQLSLDESQPQIRPGRFALDFRRNQWPHGDTGAATPHGAVFSLPVLEIR